jgi:hypothetical protein
MQAIDKLNFFLQKTETRKLRYSGQEIDSCRAAAPGGV